MKLVEVIRTSLRDDVLETVCESALSLEKFRFAPATDPIYRERLLLPTLSTRFAHLKKVSAR